MKVLICVNHEKNPYVSTLSDAMMMQLADECDVVVNELSQPDYERGTDTKCVHLAIANELFAKEVEAILEREHARYKPLERGTLAWPETKIGLAVFLSAESIAAIFRRAEFRISYYNGPTGHPAHREYVN